MKKKVHPVHSSQICKICISVSHAMGGGVLLVADVREVWKAPSECRLPLFHYNYCGFRLACYVTRYSPESKLPRCITLKMTNLLSFCFGAHVTGASVSQCVQLHLHSYLRGRDDDQGNCTPSLKEHQTQKLFSNHTSEEIFLFPCGDQNSLLSQFTPCFII